MTLTGQQEGPHPPPDPPEGPKEGVSPPPTEQQLKDDIFFCTSADPQAGHSIASPPAFMLLRTENSLLHFLQQYS